MADTPLKIGDWAQASGFTEAWNGFLALNHGEIVTRIYGSLFFPNLWTRRRWDWANMRSTWFLPKVSVDQACSLQEFF
jgi:hypothetical protein